MNKIELITNCMDYDGMGNQGRFTAPPSPPKDRIIRESSWLETITFGMYKTKYYHKREK
jgi:hypothetical protein